MKKILTVIKYIMIIVSIFAFASVMLTNYRNEIIDPANPQFPHFLFTLLKSFALMIFSISTVFFLEFKTQN